MSVTLFKVFLNKFTSTQFFVDLIKISLYPAEFSEIVASASDSNSTIQYLRRFLIDLEKAINKDLIINIKQIKQNIAVVKSILNIKESGKNIITYSNVFQHIDASDLSIKNLIQQAINQRIYDLAAFRKELDNILVIIQAFYEINSMAPIVRELGKFAENNEDKPIFETLKDYKELIIKAYSNLTQLSSLYKAESLTDYFLISDSKSARNLARNITEYIGAGYSFFRSGYDIIEDTIGGLESASLHLIVGATNHGKSLYLINLCRNLIIENLLDFQPQDVIIYITLEDDIYKLSRRFISIFGNYHYNEIRNLFKVAYGIMKKDKDLSIKKNIESLFTSLLNSSILQTTKGKINLVIKHSNENSFTPGDLEQFIDRLKVDGYNTKMVFIDYINVMAPTISNYGKYEDYGIQGQIVQELRLLTRRHKIPIITASQNRRQGENEQIEMTNELVGDSYRKVQFSDNIYMIRKRTNLNILSDAVREDILTQSEYLDGEISPHILQMKDSISENLIPFQVKITKAKDSDKDVSKFSLLCKLNLKIYDNLNQYISDYDECIKNTQQLQKQLQLLKKSQFMIDELEL